MSRNPAKLFFSGHRRLASGIKEANGDPTIRWEFGDGFRKPARATRIST